MSDDIAQRHIAELASEGVAEGEGEVGEWTLDEAAARTKLAEYRLGDVDVWPCAIVEAAMLLGASTILFEPSDETLVVTFDGQPLALDGFFARSLGSRRGSDVRAARKLAIALETMLERKDVSMVEIESGQARLVLDRQAWQVRPHARSETTTRLVAHRTGTWNELSRLRTEARYARAQVTVKRDFPTGEDREVISPSTPKVDGETARERWPITDGEPPIGWLHHGEAWSKTPSSLIIVSDGVIAETMQLGGVGELVLLDVSLDKDLGENRVLRNAELERLMVRVEEARVAHPFVAGPRPSTSWSTARSGEVTPWHAEPTPRPVDVTPRSMFEIVILGMILLFVLALFLL